jgi:hypothetical protein
MPGCFITVNTRETVIQRFDVAVGTGFGWVNRTRGDPISRNAVIAGFNANRQDVFICQATFNNGRNNVSIPGKLENSTCFVVYGGREQQFDSHRILVNF